MTCRLELCRGFSDVRPVAIAINLLKKFYLNGGAKRTTKKSTEEENNTVSCFEEILFDIGPVHIWMIYPQG